MEIPARSAYVGVVRLALGALARAVRLDEEVVEDLKIAVSEACTNAVLSHEQTRCRRSGHRDLARGARPSLGGDRRSRAPSYDPENLDVDDTQTLRLSMSVAMLRSLVDDCEISPRSGPGMSTRFVVPRAPAGTEAPI